MQILENVFFLLGGIGTFLIGLKLLSGNVGKLVGNKLSAIIKNCTENRLGAFVVGMSATAVLQSSIATNMIAIAFVEKGILSFVSCSAVILGTNVGTTVTAQLVSMSTISDFEISAIGCFIVFLGFLCSLSKREKVNAIGNALFGFGLVFIGLKLMTEAVERFKTYGWFTNLFLVKSPAILLLNGILITCVVQSSSVVTSIMIVLSSLGLLDFYRSIFIILGTNVGTCLPVIFSSMHMGAECKKAALFNLVFNVFGAIIFFPLVRYGYDFLSPILQLSATSVGRNVANFHTVFNLSVGCIVMPILKPFCGVVEKIYTFLYDDKKFAHKKQKNKKINKVNNLKRSVGKI